MDQKLIYAFIARDKEVVLADFNIARGSYTQQIFEVLKILMANCRESCVAGDYVFHVINEGKFAYGCLASEGYKRRIAFQFLEQMKDEFQQHFSETQRNTAINHSLSAQFKPKLQKKVEYFNTPECDQIWRAEQQVQEGQDIMTRNLEKILDRGFKIDIMVEKTETMNAQAQVFKKEATNIKRKMWWRNWGLKIALVFLILLIIYLIVGFTCTWTFHACRK